MGVWVGLDAALGIDEIAGGGSRRSRTVRPDEGATAAGCLCFTLYFYLSPWKTDFMAAAAVLRYRRRLLMKEEKSRRSPSPLPHFHPRAKWYSVISWVEDAAFFSDELSLSSVVREVKYSAQIRNFNFICELLSCLYNFIIYFNVPCYDLIYCL